MPDAIASILFVLVWSTGFVVARATIAHADPQYFSLIRMLATAAILAVAAGAMRERRILGRRIGLHLAAGALLPGAYLCASWRAVQAGMPAGIMSLLGALQPLPIALIAFALFGERLDRRSIAGIGIGAAGAAMVLAPLLERGGGVAALPAAMGLFAVTAMAAVTIVQQRALSGDPLLSACALQNAGGAVVAVLAFATVGQRRWDGDPMLWGAFAWAVLGLSIAGLVLLARLARRQGATRVSTLLLLVPPLAAIEARMLFSETLAAIQIAGFALALGGVLLARRRATPVEQPA